MSNKETLKFVYLYGSSRESDLELLENFHQAAREHRQSYNLLFAQLNLDKNEIPEFESVELPALIALTGTGDLEAENYEGSWTVESLSRFISTCR